MLNRIRIDLVPILLPLIVLLFVSGASAADGYQDLIDPTIHHQTIEYFTASDCWSIQEMSNWSVENRTKLADLLFSTDKGIGLSAWRFNLPGGEERTQIRNPWRTGECFEVSQGKYDWTRCAGQRWFLAAAKQRGVGHFIAFCNTPPKRLTINGLTSISPNSKVTNNLRPGSEREFGAYLGDILVQFRDDPDAGERINFDWVSPINEPQWDWTGGQEGSRASNADIVRQYKAIAAELSARDLATHILGPESGSIPDMYHPAGASGKFKTPFGNYIDLLCGDPAMAPILGHTIAYHSYWSDEPNAIIEHRKKLRAALDEHPGWQAAESEYCVMEPGKDLSMATAIRAARIVHADLTIVNSCTWSWWLALSNGNYKDGMIYTTWRRPGDEQTIQPSKWFWAYGNYARFIRPGMMRVDLKSQGTPHDINGVMGSAYRDPATNRIVAVYINAKTEPASLVLRLGKSYGIKWIPYVTSDTEGDDLKPYPAFASDQPFTLPGKSVVTFVAATP